MTTLELIEKIFSQPTAPFRERFVLESIENIAIKYKIPYFKDRAGNLIVGAKNAHVLSRDARMLLFAHTDHPGFHVVSQKGLKVMAKWYGGAPFNTMVGAKVRIYDPTLSVISNPGRVIKIESKKYKRTGMKMEILLQKNIKLNKGSFGAFDFPAYKISRGVISTRAADDLAGCVIALGAVIDTRKSKRPVVGIFTRAEEVGFIGCWSFLKSYKLSSKSIAVSLEASRTLPGAELGKGPVLRIGDRTTVFDNMASQHLFKIAQKLSKKKILFQRRLMDGGSCEATALNLFGIKTTGLAVPLMNYHNQGARGPAPEVIRLIDVEFGRRICAEAGRMIDDAFQFESNLKNGLDKNFKSLNRKLGQNKTSFLE